MCSDKKYLSHQRCPSARRPNNNAVSGGFPHSDIPGSKGALASPGLIAECHVLHRLSPPRHPPNALLALDPIQKKTGPFARALARPTRPLGFRSEVIRPAPPRFSAEAAPAEIRTALRARRISRSVCFDLERLLSPQGPRRDPAGLRPTRRTPDSVSCFCSLNDVTKPGRPRPGQSMRLISRPDGKARPQTRPPVRSKALRSKALRPKARAGGAYRDRTGDLMLAKHALSQLS